MFSNRTINFASPPRGSFWWWSPEYEAVEWYDGSTLALWQELHALLKFLGDDSGLPPLGAVLLLLAACRDEWLSLCIPFHEKVMSILGVTNSDAIPLEIKETLVRGLKTVHDLPKDLRSSFPAKCLLLSALFEGGPHSLPKDETKKILSELAIHGPRGLHGSSPQMDAKARFMRDLRALRVGLARHDAVSLESRLRTGLEDFEIQAPLLDDAPSSAPRHLLDWLANAGGECGAAAGIAKQTIAMINFPGNFRTHEGLPVGGISDITNSGTLDRLLPGELAADDLTLAVRLVHNEALYFRREIPPQDLAVSHTILMDRGLRLWGTSRVVAIGVALGLRHHPALNRPGVALDCFAASVESFDILDLATPGGVYSALETLVTVSDPDAFLTAWYHSVFGLDETSVPDVSLITSEAHLVKPSTLELLSEIATWIRGKAGSFRVVAINREGGFEVRSWSPGGNRILFRGRIDLEKMFQKPAGSPKRAVVPALRTKTVDPLHDLLPIYALEKFPFLFPQIPQASAFLPLGNSPDSPVLGVSNNHQLMLWPKVGWGGQELVSSLPGRQHWMGWSDDREPIIIASGSAAGDSVSVFRFVQDIIVGISICASKHPFPRFAAVSGGAVLLAYSECVEAISLSSGNRVALLPIDELPARPVLDFDGETIRMSGHGTEWQNPLQDWSSKDPFLPNMIKPDGVAFVSGALRVRCAENIYGFSPLSMTWEKVKTSSISFAEFEKSDLSPNSVLRLELARLSLWMEVWLDPRGILHLRQPTNTGSSWSILLSTVKASVWHADWGLCSTEPRLRLPQANMQDTSAAMALRDFLTFQPASP